VLRLRRARQPRQGALAPPPRRAADQPLNGAPLTTPARSQLLLPLRDRAQFAAQAFDHDTQGGLFVPGDVDVEEGEDVDLEIAFMREQVRFHIRAVVLWKRASAGRRAEAGVGLGFPESEAATRDRILAFARGSDVDHVEREARRYALHLEVKLTVDGEARVVSTDDMSEGGCFLLVEPPLPMGTAVRVTLRAPGALFSWLTLHGRVAWQRTQPGRTGVGVAFLFDDGRERRRMEKLLVLLRERLGREVHVKPVRASSTSTHTPSMVPVRSSLLPRK
jgi:Tfp pilus assembly protein PilZ